MRVAMLQVLALGAWTLSGVSVQAQTADPSKPSPEAQVQAEALFTEYVALGRAFEPGVADLYSDRAIIVNRRRGTDGRVRFIELRAKEYKERVRKAAPLAKASGDTSTYRDCQYSAEGARVRIKCVRYSELKKYESPLVLLVGPDDSGKWLIHEERTDSKQ